MAHWWGSEADYHRIPVGGLGKSENLLTFA